MLASLYTIKNTEGKELLQTFLHTGAVLRWNSLLLQKRRGVKRNSVSVFHRHYVFQKGLELCCRTRRSVGSLYYEAKLRKMEDILT